MKIVKTVLALLALLIAGVLIAAATRPDSFSVQRNATIAAPPERLFGLIADMKAFNSWNPWLRKEPTSKLTYSGPASGVGAAYAWDGEQLGAGRMEVIEAQPPGRVAMKLDFIRPFASTNRVEFTLQPQGAQTQVTWAMSGPMPFLSKLFSLVAGMDGMIGPDFEAGLANLKALAEKG